MRKKKEEIIETKPVTENITDNLITLFIRDNYLPYAMSVIISRALPAIEDGLKPSQRKILYTMYNMGLLNGSRTKSANIAGKALQLNPHSSDSAYETMVRLSQENETLLTPFVDGKGNFGKHYNQDAYAAMRYTEARLMPIAAEAFKNIKNNVVKMVPNYDDTMLEPEFLPMPFPNILANPTKGIAVGFSSNIPSFNLGELCDATILRVKKPNANIEEIMPAPDFATGGYILLDKAVMAEIYRTGRGSIKQRAKYRVDAKKRIIEINEIPFETTVEQIMESVIDNVKKGKIKEINDIRDETDLKGLKIAIDYKKGVEPEDLIKKLYKLTPMQCDFACNFNVILNNQVKTIGVYGILDDWIAWRRECVKKEYENKLQKTSHDLHLLKGLEKLLLNIDKAIKIIRQTENDKDVVPNLMKAFKVDEEQGNYIAEIKLRNLNKEYILNRTKNIADLEKEIEGIKKVIGNQKEIDKVIISVLTDIKKKYGKPRKSEITAFVEEEVEDVSYEDYEATLFITKDGYIKKVRTLKEGQENKIKDGDILVDEFKIRNLDELLIFTDKQNCYKVFAYQLKEAKLTDQPEYISNITEMDPDESVVYVCPINAASHILFAFENGKIARIPLKSYETKTNRKKLVNAYYADAKLIGVSIAENEDKFIINSEGGRSVVFKAEQVSEKTTKNSQGIQVISILKSDSNIIGLDRYNGKRAIARKVPASGR